MLKDLIAKLPQEVSPDPDDLSHIAECLQNGMSLRSFYLRKYLD